MSEKDEHLPVLAQLEALRRSGDGRAWAKIRRLIIVAPCCPRFCLIEVMNTDPPCVLVRQIEYGHVDPEDTERKPWSGARHSDQGVAWLATFERMAETSSKQIALCQHGRWYVSAHDVVTRRGRHVLPVSDKCR